MKYALETTLLFTETIFKLPDFCLRELMVLEPPNPGIF